MNAKIDTNCCEIKSFKKFPKNIDTNNIIEQTVLIITEDLNGIFILSAPYAKLLTNASMDKAMTSNNDSILKCCI